MKFTKFLNWSKSHWLISSFACLSVIFTALLYINAPNVYAADGASAQPSQVQIAQSNPLGGAIGGSQGTDISSCSLEQIGWLACPIVRSVAKAADAAWTFITRDFMVVEVQMLNGSSPTSAIWGAMRNIANVLFVMAFLVVVYSLLTSTGITSYDLKRLVPRLLVAAILVNLSFYVCLIMVDLATVTGAFILDIIQNLLGQGTTTGMPLDKARGDIQVLEDIAVSILASQEVAWLLLAPLVAMVFSAAILCSVILIILILRKVLVVAMIVVSPLAFVAYLLPNTEQYFTKWLKLFFHLLLIFPIIALLLGAGQVVSAAIIKAEDGQGAASYKTEGDSYYTNNGGGDKSATLRLIAAGAAILPLAGTWYAFKGMTALMDSAGVRIAQRRGRGSRSGSSDDAAKREAAFDLNKSSKMMNGLNKIQQITAMQDGGSNVSFIRGGRRNFKKSGKSTKSAAQSDFDSKVQQRLGELRTGSSGGGSTPQQAYMQALQRYQDKQADIGGGPGSGDLSINSYEGIDLKASEAYLLESLGKGAASSLNNTNIVNAQSENTSSGGNNSGGNSNNKNGNGSGNSTDDKDKDDKKSAGISSLKRDGKDGGGGGGGEQQDSYRPPSGDKSAALNSALTGTVGGTAATTNSGGASGGNTQIIAVQSNEGGTGAPRSMDMSERRSASHIRPTAMTGSEMKAKARAAKYVAGSQDSLFDRSDDSDITESASQSDDALQAMDNLESQSIDLRGDDDSSKE